MKTIYICCPGNMLTGGPEALHQLYGAIKSFGYEVYMLYFPFNKFFTSPLAYQEYGITIADYNREKVKGNVVILPEAYPHLHQLFPESIKLLWWLSVDNYGKAQPQDDQDWLITQPENYLSRDFLHQAFNGHLAQSEYARLFLKDNGLDSFMISDYLNKEYLNMSFGVENKENIIAFNPIKGFEITSELIRRNQQFNFLSIAGMPRAEVVESLSRCKVYIDFGTHPGKDRIPREAALAGCCVVTGLQGSAGNAVDIPIPDKYKLDSNASDFYESFTDVIGRIFDAFPEANADFEAYRARIRMEPQVFSGEVKHLLDAIAAGC